MKSVPKELALKIAAIIRGSGSQATKRKRILEEERRYYSADSDKAGQKRKVPRIAFKETSVQNQGTGRIATKVANKKEKTVAVKKIRDATTGRLASTTRSPMFGKPKRLPSGLTPKFGVGTGLIGMLPLDSTETNMVTIKDQNNKSIRVPDTYAAKIRDINALNKKSGSLSFEEMFNEARKLGMAGFKWDGKNYKTQTDDKKSSKNIYDKTIQKIAKDKENNRVPIMYEGTYLGSRNKSVTEGVKEVKEKEQPKKAPKTGTRAKTVRK